ncbi:MAG: radical SAM protein [Pseudomonadota bacterium]
MPSLIEATEISCEKFVDPDFTAAGEARASVALARLETLWINTGSLCNIECENCYIESSPSNDRLAYISEPEVAAFLDEIQVNDLGTWQIGFTGGEPFMNPEIVPILRNALQRGFDVLVLTNAMQPMMRPRLREGMRALLRHFRDRLTLRVSLDHYAAPFHDRERGAGSFAKACEGLHWLCKHGFKVSVAGRACWAEDLEEARSGYQDLFEKNAWPIDAYDPSGLVLFPEMLESRDVPEITTACWDILGKSPGDVMCATSRMVVKRRGAASPVVLPCTLLPYDPRFEMGSTLSEARTADGGSFRDGAVKLNHPYCAEFCVLGGSSCSG